MNSDFVHVWKLLNGLNQYWKDRVLVDPVDNTVVSIRQVTTVAAWKVKLVVKIWRWKHHND